MLDTFSFEPYIKSYHWFTFRSLEFSEIAFRSLSSSPVCLSLLSLTADSATPPAAALGRPGQVRLRLRFTWRPRKLLDPLSPRAGASTPRHATPTSPEPPRGRHRDAAVASSPQSPSPRSRARLGTTNSPANHPLRLFPDSPTPDPGTPPPPSTERRRA